MAIFKELTALDVQTSKSSLTQPVDILQNDISGSLTRRLYQHYVTGGVGPGITSSLFQTVFDQDYTLQTANPVFDFTIGLHKDSTLVTGATSSVDATTNRYYFNSQSVMMPEKMDNYRLFAQELLGDGTATFQLVTSTTTVNVREPLFICFKRLFKRDRIERETSAIRLYQSTAFYTTQATSEKIYTDIGASSNIETGYGGQVSLLVDSAAPTYPVGQLFLDKGVMVLDTQRIFDVTTQLSGTIDAISTLGTNTFTGSFNQFMVSASIDDVLDHIAITRFSSGSLTAIAFKNQTYMNKTNFSCRLRSNEFNYSSNPTYVDANGRIVVIDPGQEDSQRSFTFITSVGFYDANNNLMGVAKLSRPILKDLERDLIIKSTIHW